MINIDLLRTNDNKTIISLTNRNVDKSELDKITKFDAKRRKLIENIDLLRSKRNTTSKELSKMKDKPQNVIDEMRLLGKDIKEKEKDLSQISEQLNSLLLTIPNIPAKDVPIGENEDLNKIIYSEKYETNDNFNPLPHWDIGTKLDLIDFERGTKLSGSRFYILKNKAAQLQRALTNWMLDNHLNNDYQEHYLPNLVKESVVRGAGQLPKFKDTMFSDQESELWLIPTAEVPITNIYANEIITSDQLPIKIVAQTSCFRNEKAAAGKDTRGIKRVHQFEKVELYQFVEPEKSEDALDSMLNACVDLCKKLGLTYRIKLLCTGDLGFCSNKTYDIEVWSPGSQEWLEVSSVSNCTDFQSRRSNTKFKKNPKSKTEYLHTLNGSGLALPRIIIAILETYQNEDLSIDIPETLWDYTKFKKIS
tara:strand:+ start:20143 stop:21402 length:1260 start_codon:yes stop_codon:yes gene_type:complete